MIVVNRSPAQQFSDAAAEASKVLRDAAHAIDMCQDALGAAVGVSQTTAGKWMSSLTTDSIPLARLAMGPRDLVVGVCRGLLAHHHAVVVDLLEVDSSDSADDVLAQVNRAQQASSNVLSMVIGAVGDRAITASKARAIEVAIDATLTHLVGIRERMQRIQRNGVEGVGPVRLEAVR